jgi:autotransporter-associated beta strand protein
MANTFLPRLLGLPRHLAFAAGGALLLSVPASAQWIGASSDATNDSAHDYNATGNWSGGTINDTFSPSTALGGDTTIYLSGDRTTTGDLTFTQTGTGTLTLQGGGGGTPIDHTLTLQGGINVNTAAGPVVLGSATGGSNLNIDLGGAGRTFTVQSGNTLTALNTVSNGSLVVSGGGTVQLGGTNTFAGGIVVANGTLNSYGENATSAFGSGTITLGGGDGTGNAILGHASGSNSIANAITVAAGTGLRSIAPGSGNDTYTGAITLANNLTLASSSNGALNINGGITGTGNVTVNQTVATYTSFSTGDLNFTGTLTNESAGTGDVTINSAIGANVTGLVQNSLTSTLVVTGNHDAFTGGLTITAGTLRVQSGGAISGAVNGTGTAAIAGGGEVTLTGDLSGFTGLYDVQTTDGGKLSIKNTNTAVGSSIHVAAGATVFAENVTVNSNITVAGSGNNEDRGALRLNSGTTVNGNVTLAGNTTVGGGGTIAGVISDGGAAASLGTSGTDGNITLTGANTFTGGAFANAGGNLRTGATGTFGNGNVTVASTGTLTLGNFESISNTGTLFVAEDSFVVLGGGSGVETIAALVDTTTNTSIAAGTYSAAQLNALFGNNGVFSGDGSITIAAVPEPMTLGLLGAGLVLLAVRRRANRIV